MKYSTALTSILLSAVICIAAGNAHYQSTREYDDAVKNAKAIAVAEVVSAEKDESRCETSFRFGLKALYSIKGTVNTEKTYPFSYTVYYWKKATFPWQKECPSVHYRMPPVAENMNVGSKVIITIEYWEPGKTDAVVSTRDIIHLDQVKQVIRGK
jgi:hypothetical protein